MKTCPTTCSPTRTTKCWKLGAVLSGSLPESVLDTYQAERLPHVKEVTNRAVKTGKLIIQHSRWRAAVRNHVFRTASRVPYFLTWLRDHRWIPDARYRDGLVAKNGNGAVGWLIPQPWVIDEKGILMDQKLKVSPEDSVEKAVKLLDV